MTDAGKRRAAASCPSTLGDFRSRLASGACAPRIDVKARTQVMGACHIGSVVFARANCVGHYRGSCSSSGYVPARDPPHRSTPIRCQGEYAGRPGRESHLRSRCAVKVPNGRIGHILPKGHVSAQNTLRADFKGIRCNGTQWSWLQHRGHPWARAQRSFWSDRKICVGAAWARHGHRMGTEWARVPKSAEARSGRAS